MNQELKNNLNQIIKLLITKTKENKILWYKRYHETSTGEKRTDYIYKSFNINFIICCDEIICCNESGNNENIYIIVDEFEFKKDDLCFEKLKELLSIIKLKYFSPEGKLTVLHNRLQKL